MVKTNFSFTKDDEKNLLEDWKHNEIHLSRPPRFLDLLNSGSFISGLFESVGITTTPNTLSPDWRHPVPWCHFNNDCSEIPEGLGIEIGAS